ncbi:MAG: hypothetical protein E5Y34_11100 [Mesorhizobium sp.]|uniref:hypothetical protein n=1 Tax=Mesorhizobium sp. TaxID=1871066 RepID=UPI0012285405|nr:hypothetical protein [Mesorhizobium sp.]TIN00995.1 MAG: hypothetical protein E5Y34_11100 [Mesorhizobium sp.]
MTDGFYMSGPEEGDKVDQTVLVCDADGNEVIQIHHGSLRGRKAIGRHIAKLLNKGAARILS